jgi:hypothetical protein
VVTVTNGTKKATTVYASFGADSGVKADDWKAFCTITAPLNCNFKLDADKAQELPADSHLNVTLSFDGQGCGATKAEVNVNNPKWYDVVDISLVDGFSNAPAIKYTPPTGAFTLLGPPTGKDTDALLLGVYPTGCDICTARENPPCGQAPGGTGCKAGTQYDPTPPCQFQGPVKGGGGSVEVILGLEPA